MLLFSLLLMLEGTRGAAARESIIGSDHFVKISEKIKPSVVNIVMTRPSEPPKARLRLLSDRFFGRKKIDDIEDFFSYVLFREYPQRDFTEKMAGSGVVIRSDGLILTNDHVVTDKGTLEVILSDGRTFPAKIIGKDYLIDLAVIKIDADGLPVVRFGDSESLRVGEWVLAIGNSLGLRYTVSAGIVSAMDRNLIEESGRPYWNMIQTDAPINLGNSGGPLVNMKGEVVGINASIIPKGQSIGFAVPINEAKGILSDLITQGEVKRGWLGVIFRLQQGGEHSFIVDRIVSGGPADKAGLLPGDKIVAVDGMVLDGQKEIHDEIMKMEIGSKMKFLVERGRKTETVAIVVEPLPVLEFKNRRTYPSGFEGFILRLPTRTRWFLIVVAVLFMILLLDVKRDMDRRVGRIPRPRENERRQGNRRVVKIPFKEVRVTAQRRKADRRDSERRQKRHWFS